METSHLKFFPHNFEENGYILMKFYTDTFQTAQIMIMTKFAEKMYSEKVAKVVL